MQSLFIMHIALGGCLRGTPRYGLTEDTGGHITYILGEAKAMARRRDVGECEIVTRLFEDDRLGTIHAEPSERVAPKLTITRIDSGDRRYLAKEALAADRDAFAKALIADLHQRNRLPDAIHAHFADAADVALRVREIFGIPVIYTPHSLGRDKLDAGCAVSPGFADRLAEEDRAIAGADAVIASSRDECERQVTSYSGARPERIWRVHPGIDQTRASLVDERAAGSLIEPFLRNPGRPIILAIARPVRKKNLAGLVQAFADHPQLREMANLVILPGLRTSVESGESEQVAVMRELVDLIDGHDLHGSVAYPRHHDASAVRGLYALAAKSGGIFCNPAMFEPFGLTILEAAVHALPVVATDRGGPSDIVGEIGHGLVVNPGDPPALGGSLHRLLSDRGLYAECARNAARKIGEVTWDRYADQCIAILRTLRKGTTRMVDMPRSRRILLCDIDNTLTGCRRSARELTDYLKTRPDITFGIATGRSLPEARRLLLEWNLPAPSILITSVGSEIYWDDEHGLRADTEYDASISGGWSTSRIERLLSKRADVPPQPPIEQRRFKRSYFCEDPALPGQIERDLMRESLPAKVIYSHHRLLDILPARAGKGEAARHVLRCLGLPDECLIVAGDSGNDADMVRVCRNPIIVANSEPALIEQGRDHAGAFMASRPYSAGVLEGLLALTEKHISRSAA